LGLGTRMTDLRPAVGAERHHAVGGWVAAPVGGGVRMPPRHDCHHHCRAGPTAGLQRGKHGLHVTYSIAAQYAMFSGFTALVVPSEVAEFCNENSLRSFYITVFVASSRTPNLTGRLLCGPCCCTRWPSWLTAPRCSPAGAFGGGGRPRGAGGGASRRPSCRPGGSRALRGASAAGRAGPGGAPGGDAAPSPQPAGAPTRARPLSRVRLSSCTAGSAGATKDPPDWLHCQCSAVSY
jgi:hypothetical protein